MPHIPNHPSAQKRHRQSLKREARNRAIKTRVRTAAKQALVAIEGNSKEAGEEALRNFEVSEELASLPTALKHPVVVQDDEDRPQPRKDANTGHGMAAVVGRVRECPLLDVKLTLLSHNLVRGAAGAALLNAELLASRGFLKARQTAGTPAAEEVSR
jgi:aspartate-semialdehyde dehydrogenase